ncbi:hypothetical protein ACP70R_009542 [Stipagrostis hirtigluma subsp. patula]
MATPYFRISPAQYVLCQNEISMKLYLHQVADGPNKNQEQMVNPIDNFGTIAVNDWTVIDGPNPNSSRIVARAKGTHILADKANSGWYLSAVIVFEDNRFKGSSLQVMGFLANAGELAIIGGTGEFKMARGTIKYNLLPNPPVAQSIRELDIQAFYTPITPPARTTQASEPAFIIPLALLLVYNMYYFMEYWNAASQPVPGGTTNGCSGSPLPQPGSSCSSLFSSRHWDSSRRFSRSPGRTRAHRMMMRAPMIRDLSVGERKSKFPIIMLNGGAP